jgi:hypothetical protein
LNGASIAKGSSTCYFKQPSPEDPAIGTACATSAATPAGTLHVRRHPRAESAFMPDQHPPPDDKKSPLTPHLPLAASRQLPLAATVGHHSPPPPPSTLPPPPTSTSTLVPNRRPRRANSASAATLQQHVADDSAQNSRVRKSLKNLSF